MKEEQIMNTKDFPNIYYSQTDKVITAIILNKESIKDFTTINCYQKVQERANVRYSKGLLL